MIKTGRRRVNYQLENGEALHAAHPATFHLPPRAVREQLEPGDFAKLIFLIPESRIAEVGFGAERMWVAIRTRENDHYEGYLDSDPDFIRDLKRGDPVSFDAAHIISIERAKPKAVRS